MTNSDVNETGFFVELPEDEHGNTLLRLVVVEARIEHTSSGNSTIDYLVPIAPNYALRWPGGWPVNGLCGRWVKIDNGPARELSRLEYYDIIAPFCPEWCTNLKNGKTVFKPALEGALYTLELLANECPADLRALFEICADPNKHYVIPQSSYGYILLYENGGGWRIPEYVRAVVTAALVKDPDGQLQIVSPLA